MPDEEHEGDEAAQFIDAWERAAIKWAKVGLIDVAAHDCEGEGTRACENALGKEFNRQDLPRVAYYSPWSTKPQWMKEKRGTITYPKISSWFETVVPDVCTKLSTVQKMT